MTPSGVGLPHPEGPAPVPRTGERASPLSPGRARARRERSGPPRTPRPYPLPLTTTQSWCARFRSPCRPGGRIEIRDRRLVTNPAQCPGHAPALRPRRRPGCRRGARVSGCIGRWYGHFMWLAHQSRRSRLRCQALVVDPRQHRLHFALARTTPRTFRCTAFPWLAAELQHRVPGSTAVGLHRDPPPFPPPTNPHARSKPLTPPRDGRGVRRSPALAVTWPVHTFHDHPEWCSPDPLSVPAASMGGCAGIRHEGEVACLGYGRTCALMEHQYADILDGRRAHDMK
jgi:hypothetical protein